jgi:hypothetical protein
MAPARSSAAWVFSASSWIFCRNQGELHGGGEVGSESAGDAPAGGDVNDVGLAIQNATAIHKMKKPGPSGIFANGMIPTLETSQTGFIRGTEILPAAADVARATDALLMPK